MKFSFPKIFAENGSLLRILNGSFIRAYVYPHVLCVAIVNVVGLFQTHVHHDDQATVNATMNDRHVWYAPLVSFFDVVPMEKASVNGRVLDVHLHVCLFV